MLFTDHTDGMCAGGGPNLGAELDILNASNDRNFHEVFANLIQLQAGGVVIARNAFHECPLLALSGHP